MNFEPVRTRADLQALRLEDVVLGYTETRPGDPEPGVNRGRAYWHGWRCRMFDYGELGIDDAHRALVHEIALHGRLF